MITEFPRIYIRIPNYEEKSLAAISPLVLFLFGPPLYVPGRTPQRHPGAAGGAAALGQQPAKPFLSCLVGVGNQEVDGIPGMSAIEVSGVCVYFHTSIFSQSLGWRDVNE